MANNMTHSALPRVPAPVKSAASVIAIICAVASFIPGVNAGLRLLLVAIAVGAALVGLLKAVHPQVSGGILSMVAILLAAIGLVVALVDVVF